MARMDHTNCTHPRTPAGRATCRKNATVTPSLAPDRSLFAIPTSKLTADEITAANEAMSELIGTDPIDHRVDDADNQALVQQVIGRMTRAQLASPTIQSMLPKK